jgi:Fe-S-cluster containining protein
VPNFLLGLALNDPATAPLIERMIASGLATPEGMQATPVQLRKSLEQAQSPHSHGEPAVVCGFLDTQARRCGIYKYRDSVCATFFCKHDQKDDGYEFWRSLQAVAGQCEAALSQLLMADLGMDVDAYIARFDALADAMPELVTRATDAWPPEALASLWDQWSGREAEFYRACAERVRVLGDDLEERLEAWKIRSPWRYDAAFRASLPPELKEQMLKDDVRVGEPVPISDLWYQFKLVHRNLWQ